MRSIVLLPAFALLAALLPAQPVAAGCVVSTPDSRCTTPGYAPGDCTVNALDSDCREGASCTVNALSANCFGSNGTCTVNASGAVCQGHCAVNANLAYCGAPSSNCPVNVGLCFSNAECLVNAGLCDNGAECLVNLGWCGGGGDCAVNVASPLAPTPATEPDCWGNCTINYGDACRAARCDNAVLSLHQDLVVDGLVLCL